jgi:hypothetical protein
MVENIMVEDMMMEEVTNLILKVTTTGLVKVEVACNKDISLTQEIQYLAG